MAPTFRALLLISSNFFLSCSLAQQCYFTDGTNADNDFACVDNTDVSPCCGAGETCLTNGLCFDGLNLNRGSCTDQNWQSSLCTQICTQYLYTGLWPCGNGTFTCIYGQCADALQLSAGRIQTNSVLASSLNYNAPTATITSAANTITSTRTLTPIPTASRTGTAGSPSGKGVSSGAAAGIGAGIGVPLLLTTAAATALFLVERRRRRRAEASLATVPTVQSHYGAAGGLSGYTDTQGYHNTGYSNILPNEGMEMDGLRSPQELDNSRRTAELAASPTLRK